MREALTGGAPMWPSRRDTGARVDAAVRRLAASTGDPVCAYLYDLSALRDHARHAVDHLPQGCRLLYAVKANDQPAILRTLAGVVHGFDAASGGELDAVRAAAPHACVVIGGPGKTDDELAAALVAGAELVNVESAHELARLEQVAGRLGRRARACLRVNLTGPLPAGEITMAGRPSQFGVDEEQVPAVLRRARRCPHVHVVGFHYHSVSNHLDAAGHLALVERYLERSTRWTETAGLDLHVVNAGGGIGVDIRGARHLFDWPRFTAGLAGLLAGLARSPTLLFECGRYLTAACGTYATEVLDLKRSRGTWYAVVRGGTHHLRLPASWGYSHPFRVLPVERWDYLHPRPEIADTQVTVAGQLCSPKDLLARDTPVDRLRVGDILLFPFAGAYGWAISHHDFLRHPHPTVVLLGAEPTAGAGSAR